MTGWALPGHAFSQLLGAAVILFIPEDSSFTEEYVEEEGLHSTLVECTKLDKSSHCPVLETFNISPKFNHTCIPALCI